MRIGIDLGGTKIEGIALSGDGDELFRDRIETPQGRYDEILQSIHDLILHIEEETGQRGSIGIGPPGAISPATGLMKNSNSVTATLNSRISIPVSSSVPSRSV